MDMVNIKINGVPCEVPANATILEAAREAGIDIPTLCFLKDINQIGACRMCMVEVKGARSLVAACVYPVNEGMEVFTNTPKVQPVSYTHLDVYKRQGLPNMKKYTDEMVVESVVGEGTTVRMTVVPGRKQ